MLRWAAAAAAAAAALGCESTRDVVAVEGRLLMDDEDVWVVRPPTPANSVDEAVLVNRGGREIVLADIIGNTVVLLGRESGFIAGGMTVVPLARLLLLTVGVMVTVRLLLFVFCTFPLPGPILPVPPPPPKIGMSEFCSRSWLGNCTTFAPTPPLLPLVPEVVATVLLSKEFSSDAFVKRSAGGGTVLTGCFGWGSCD